MVKLIPNWIFIGWLSRSYIIFKFTSLRKLLAIWFSLWTSDFEVQIIIFYSLFLHRMFKSILIATLSLIWPNIPDLNFPIWLWSSKIYLWIILYSYLYVTFKPPGLTVCLSIRSNIPIFTLNFQLWWFFELQN